MHFPLIDIGANLTHDSFADDLPEVMARAAAVGVERMVVTGSSDQGNIDAAELADAHPGRLFATAGVHPHHAAEYTDASDELIRSLLLRDAVVAVGECGLDYFRNFSPRDAQLEAFRSQRRDRAVEDRTKPGRAVVQAKRLMRLRPIAQPQVLAGSALPSDYPTAWPSLRAWSGFRVRFRIGGTL